MSQDPEGPRQALPDIDFATFALSLASNVLVELGEIPPPESADAASTATALPARNLALAKQTIDLLAMLQEKTHGNLSEAEAKLLEALLYDLRLKYVDATGRKGSHGPA